MVVNTIVSQPARGKKSGKKVATLIVLDGDLVFENIEAFSQQLNDLLKEGTRNVIIDMGSTRYISARAIGVIASAVKNFRARKKDLKLLNVSAPIRQILTVTGMSRTVGIYKDEDSMWASLGPQVGTLEKKSLW